MRTSSAAAGPLTTLRIVAAAVVLSAIWGCAAYTYRATPVTQLSLEKERIQSRQVRLRSETGYIELVVTDVEYPYVVGTLVGATGRVPFDLSRATKVEIGTLDRGNRVSSWVDIAVDSIRRNSAALQQRNIRLTTAEGTLVVGEVTVDAYPLATGRYASGTGSLRVDLRRDLRGVEVREADGARSFGRGIAVVGGIVTVAFVIALLTKESCPFVYVDRGSGWELVGEAYAGAAFRGIQREDLLPLLAPGDRSTLKVRLRNEARETQYTDRAELVVVDHAPNVRALSTFNGRPLLVGASTAPVRAHDARHGDVTSLVVNSDSRFWETTPDSAATITTGPLEDNITAEFKAPPSGTAVLEIEGGNTAWLDLVFGRFFAAMGGNLAKYISQGNDSAAGPRLRGWLEREGVALTVEVESPTGWTKAAVVPTVGPASLRSVAVPIPNVRAADGALRVRLHGGLGFWRVDRLALSTVVDNSPVAQVVRPSAAVGTGGRDERETLRAADGRYNALSEMMETMDMNFALPPRVPGLTRSAFLFTSGYYNVHPPVQAQYLPMTLKTIRDEPGALSRFARDLAHGYLVAGTSATLAGAPR